MVLDLLTITAIPTAIGASEAVHQQRVLDEDAESEERQTPFYLDVYCDAQSRKRGEVHDTIVVLKNGKACGSSSTFVRSMADVLAAILMAERSSQQAAKENSRH